MISGVCQPLFESVRREFARNFSERGEVGASVCVQIKGETVVDLWGGWSDPKTKEPWNEDTIAVVMSCTKGATALCGHLLADRGLLDMEMPVAYYWPEFGQRGKSRILVRHLFSHQSGLIHVRGTVSRNGFCDWEETIRLIEESAPYQRPGAGMGYHVMTHGFLIGELVRRISGKKIGEFFRDEVASPLGIDFWIGLPSTEHGRVSKLIPPPLPQSLPKALKLAMKLPPKLLLGLLRIVAPKNIPALAMSNLGGFLEGFDTPQYYESEIPSAGGITNAKGLAGMYAPLANGGVTRSGTFLKKGTLAGMRYPATCLDQDAFLEGRACFTLGFAKSWSNPKSALNNVHIGEDAFGTPGFGGSIGFADPHFGMSFGYVMNRQGEGTGLNERGQSLIDAVYEVLGSPTRAPGFWVRPSGMASDISA